jgi:Protein phosphatase 2C
MIEREKDLPITNFFILGASVIGPYHVQQSIPCQDACAFEVLPSGLSIIAVADGAGSAARSEMGAKIAVERAVQSLKETMDKDGQDVNLEIAIKHAVSSVRKALEIKASECQWELRDLACTIIVVALMRDSVAVAHIGDGAVVAKTCLGLKLLSGPEISEYANETSFLTNKDWDTALRISKVVPEILGVAVFTDGCQRAALLKTEQGFQPYDRFLEPLFSYVREVTDPQVGEQDIKNLLSSKKVCDNSEDDKTLVMAILNTER